MKRARWILGLAALLGAAAAPLRAQDSTVTLRGAILDSVSREWVAGAALTVEGTDAGATTDAEGLFLLAGVPVGEHYLTIYKEGFRFRRFRFAITPELPRDIDMGVINLPSIPSFDVVVRGTIRDVNSGQPLGNVPVSLAGRVETTTNADGSYRVTAAGLEEGTHGLFVRFIGYQSTTYPLRVREGSTEFAVDLSMQPLALDLGEIIVEGRPMMADRKLREFFQRRATGRGSYLAPWEIAEIPASRVTDILRTMRGVLVSPDRFGSRVSVTRGCQDEPTVFLDGIEIRDPDINGLLQPGDVNAIEVYNNAAQIPPQYERGTSGCGVILFWTR